MSRIRIHNLQVEGRHGVYEEERRQPTCFTVNVDIVAEDLEAAAASDDLGDTVDYAHVAEIVKDVIEGEPRQLLEALAGDVLDRLAELGGIRAATVSISKPEPFRMPAPVERVEVELTRAFTA